MYDTRIILNGTNDTRKKIVNVYSNVIDVKPPYQGQILIEDVSTNYNNVVINNVLFTPDDVGHYYYFSLSNCSAVDGARIHTIVKLGETHALTVMELQPHAQIKRRNLLSRCIDLITFHNGMQIISDAVIGKPPATITPDQLPPASSELIATIERFLRIKTF